MRSASPSGCVLKTKASSVCCIDSPVGTGESIAIPPRLPQPDFAQRDVVLAPVPANANPQPQEHATVEEFLDSHGLRNLFTFISSTPKLTGKSKHLLAIAKTFSLDPVDMLYVGDEIRDIRAAAKAHIPCAAVAWGLNSRDALASENPSHLVDTPAQLLEVCGISNEFPGISHP